MSSGTQGVLDAMTKGIMDSKAQANVRLTPVGAEREAEVAIDTRPLLDSPIAGPIPADFPWDYPLQNITSTLLKIRQQLNFLEEGCRAIEKAAGLREGGPTIPVSVAQARLDAVKSKEAESEARFQAQQAPARDLEKPELGEEEGFTEAFARKAADAQAQAFTKPHTLWTCSTHGLAEEKVSPKGRHYLACPKCTEFER